VSVLRRVDQPLIREGLTALLEPGEAIEPVALASGAEEAVALCARHRPDVVLMDPKMPVLDGVEATRRIRRAQPEVEVVVLTTDADEESVLDALDAGVLGYPTNDAGIVETTRAIDAAAAHQALLAPDVERRLLLAAQTGRPCPLVTSAELPDNLTPREAQLLARIADGLSNREIAAALVVSEATVKTHVNHLFAKIGARDRSQAVLHCASSNGLVRDGAPPG
jgi:DNA-binding NarL/FixJ family response regulator